MNYRVFVIAFQDMPRKCSIVGCRSNYKQRKGSNDNGKKVSVFRFPKEEDRMKQWLQKIPQHLTADQISDYMGICELHFDPVFVLRQYNTFGPDGTVITLPRVSPILAPDAVPTIFPNTPSYLSCVTPAKRKAPDVRRAEALAREDEAFRRWLDEDIVGSFDTFVNNLVAKTSDLNADWMFVIKSDYVLFVLIDDSSCPSVVASFKVMKDMVVLIYDNERQRDNSELTYLLDDERKLSRWSQLPAICTHMKNAISSPAAVTFDERAETVVNSLKELIRSKENEENSRLVAGLKFQLEQIQLLLASQKRYTPDCMLFAFRIFSCSSSTYNYLRDTFLTLPHPSYLRALASCFSSSDKLNDESSHLTYLKQKCRLLTEDERWCVLMLDEIYVSPKISYKGGSLYGFADNSSSDSVQASTVLAFMVSSILSKHKDIAALVPVKNMDVTFLHNCAMQVLELVEKAGFRILAFISDNNRVNRNMFEKICGGQLKSSIPHPFDSSRQLFFLFDSVHLFKSIRNNWLNQIDQTFRYPNAATAVSGELCKASFAHLKQLYDSERSATVKMAPGLTYTALHPNRIQRQSVNLAVKVFDEKNVAALQQFGKSLSCDFSGTGNFILTIAQLWKIWNVKHLYQGQRLNDEFCEPIISVADSKLHWLKLFHAWLTVWENSNVRQRGGILSKETMFALKHTIITMCSLAEYLLTNLRLRYVLLGKFQSDYLEFRFSRYRQMSGANYNVSVAQIMESEKRLKILSVLKIASCGNDFTITDFIKSCQAEMMSVAQPDTNFALTSWTSWQSVLNELDEIAIPDHEMSAIVFIAGYVGYKLKGRIDCLECRYELLTERALECDFPTDLSFDYLSAIDRGRLTWPTDLMVEIAVQTIVVFKCVVSAKYVKQFSTVHNQRSVLSELALERCKQVADVDRTCVSCGKHVSDLVNMCIRVVSNIALNNYTKQVADRVTKSKTHRKISTFVDTR